MGLVVKIDKLDIYSGSDVVTHLLGSFPPSDCRRGTGSHHLAHGFVSSASRHRVFSVEQSNAEWSD